MEAIQAGVNPDYVEEVMVLASSKKNDDNEYSDIFEEMKEKYEVFFNEDESKSKGEGDKGKGENTGGTGASMKGKEEEDDDDEGDKGVGARLGASRAAATKKENSFWK